MKIAEIITVLQSWFPNSLAESWDNVGLLLGERGGTATHIMTCLTLTPDVAEEAIAMNADLIVAHHPILFSGTKRLTSDTPDMQLVLSLARAGCAVYSPHTSFDSAENGINDSLIAGLGVSDAIPIHPAEDKPTVGTGRIGQLDHATPLSTLADRLCAYASIDGLHAIGDPERSIQTIAVACGAAGSLLDDAIAAGAELFVTGEMRFHDCLAARSRGVSVLLPGHYATERPAVEALASRLQHELPELICVPSEIERDPLTWFSGFER